MIHPLIIFNMSANFNEDVHNGLVSIVFTALYCRTWTDGLAEPQKRYSNPVKLVLVTKSCDYRIEIELFWREVCTFAFWPHKRCQIGNKVHRPSYIVLSTA